MMLAMLKTVRYVAMRPALLSEHWAHTLTAMMNVAANGLKSDSAAKLVQYDSDTVELLGSSGSRSWWPPAPPR
jgi:hypothetical protein